MDYTDIEDFNIDLDHLIEVEPIKSPVKRDRDSTRSPFPALNNTPKLEPSNDLFEVTNNISYQNLGVFGYNDNVARNPYEEDASLPRFNNDKIEKLLKELEKNQDTDELEYELDDLGRTRIFKGRFNKSNFNIETDELDNQLHDFLNDKENMNQASQDVEPSKSIRSNTRKPLKVAKPNNGAIPVLKPINSLQKPNKASTTSKKKDHSKRICKPNHRVMKASRPSIIRKPATIPSIYLVDSLTGSLNDATQFGTELNASNCEGFPLPEDVNEVVQIPTNEEQPNQQGKKNINKMAIIKTFHNKYFEPNINVEEQPHRNGFYSKQEYMNYVAHLQQSNPSTEARRSESGVEVVGQSLSPTFLSFGTDKPQKKVKFAEEDQLIW